MRKRQPPPPPVSRNPSIDPLGTLGMVLQCLGSSSDGNCYLFKARHETLIVEMGVPFAEVKKALRWRISGVVGAVVTHRHNDHAKYMPEALKAGIKVLALGDVFDARRVRNRAFCHEARPMRGYRIGGFKVFAFDVDHDVPCLGYVIEHEEMGRLLFATDTMMLRYRFPRLNHIMLECNYCDQELERRIADGVTPPSMRQRLLETHMELRTCKGVLLANDLSAVSEVVLLHLSARHSDERLFKAEVEAACGLPAHIAKAGLTLELDRTPY